MSLEIAQQYDCLVFFDMPGIEFLPGGPIVSDPPDSFRAEFQLMLEAGIGMVFLHHAIAGWPHWREYHQTIGGQFLYTQQTTETGNLMDSGYRHGVDHQITVANTAHPVAFNVPPYFSMTDELYLYEVYEHDLEPLLVSDYSFDQTQFFRRRPSWNGARCSAMTDGHIRPVALWWVGQESRTTVEFAICKVATMPQLGIIRIIGRYWITPFDGPAARFNRSK